MAAAGSSRRSTRTSARRRTRRSRVAIGNEALERYEAALARLNAGDREAVIARIELGQTYAEIASALGKPSTEAARMAVNRALARLARFMAPA